MSQEGQTRTHSFSLETRLVTSSRDSLEPARWSGVAAVARRSFESAGTYVFKELDGIMSLKEEETKTNANFYSSHCVFHVSLTTGGVITALSQLNQSHALRLRLEKTSVSRCSQKEPVVQIIAATVNFPLALC